MRVLMLSWEYPPHIVGGLGTHVAALAPALARAGVDVHLITPQIRGGATEEIVDGVHIYRVALPAMAEYSYVSYVRQGNHYIVEAARHLLADGLTFDLIHAHDWLMADAAAQLKHVWRRPLLATIHATERGRGQGYLNGEHANEINTIEWNLTFEAWRVITCSQFMAEQVQTYFQVPADKIDVVPNGVVIPPNPFATADERATFRRQFASEDQQLVYHVGRLVYEKGLHILLAAWPQVRASQPNARMLIAGRGPYLDTLKARAWELQIQHEVMFAGFVSDEDRDRLYRIADLAVIPSLYEPFGIVALEAMAANCPVIVSETGGLSEVVDGRETGLRVAANDAAALAWAIIHTLAQPRDARRRAKTAFQKVREQYNWQRVARSTADVYRRTYHEWQSGSWGKELAPI